MNYGENIHKTYALILGKFTEGLKNKLQARKYLETDINIQKISILKAIK